jgi:hypothetical protein
MTLVLHVRMPEGSKKDGAKVAAAGNLLYIDLQRWPTCYHCIHQHTYLQQTISKDLHRTHSPKAMVFMKWKCPPERRKAVIAVSAKPSASTISVNDPATNAEEERKEPFKLLISLRIVETAQPGQAITICADGSVFALSHPDDDDDLDSLDMLALKKASLASTSDASRRINLGMFILHQQRPDPERSSDLKERPMTQLLTIPAEGEVVIAHDLPLARMFKHEGTLKPADVVGETWRPKIFEGAVGTSWWCWGSLDGELKDKRLSAWREGLGHQSTPKPTADEWVLGRHPMELVFEDRTEDASFRFVE